MSKIRYSEIFFSPQLEANYTGIPTAWIRLWGCNFECQGFGQENPRDPSTWVLPYKDLDTRSIKSMEDLPVFDKGCDSSYSWSSKFRNLAHTETVEEVVNKIQKVIQSPSNPEGRFLHPKSGQDIHMAFTGGEPMMNQKSIVYIIETLDEYGNIPVYTTVETNGTFKVKEILSDLILTYQNLRGGEWFWSCSPKLSLSGEKEEDAIKPEVIAEYNALSSFGQLKYVVDGSEEVWDEVERVTKRYREAGVTFPVWIMPVGGTMEQQMNEKVGKIADEAIARGYNVAARVQNFLYANAVGK